MRCIGSFRRRTAHFLGRRASYMAGVMAGQSEMLAQGIEKGIDLTVDPQRTSGDDE